MCTHSTHSIISRISHESHAFLNIFFRFTGINHNKGKVQRKLDKCKEK
jgi:hypothetical protein